MLKRVLEFILRAFDAFDDSPCDCQDCDEGFIFVLGQEFVRKPDWDDDSSISWWNEELDVELQWHDESKVWVAIQYGLIRGHVEASEKTYYREIDRATGDEAEDALCKIWRVIWSAKQNGGLS